MILDAGTIFDRNEAAYSAAMGTPESSGRFREQYIDPAFETDTRAGQKIEAAFWGAVCEYQREGFITGFKAAAQLLMGCMPVK
ncbi:MAG: hypothetical protein LBI19_10870 [Oscillospiraceae bacterium]|nr:hypothetical protein [Oscillospiraceae bacterium]